MDSSDSQTSGRGAIMKRSPFSRGHRTTSSLSGSSTQSSPSQINILGRMRAGIKSADVSGAKSALLGVESVDEEPIGTQQLLSTISTSNSNQATTTEIESIVSSSEKRSSYRRKGRFSSIDIRRYRPKNLFNRSHLHPQEKLLEKENVDESAGDESVLYGPASIMLSSDYGLIVEKDFMYELMDSSFHYIASVSFRFTKDRTLLYRTGNDVDYKTFDKTSQIILLNIGKLIGKKNVFQLQSPNRGITIYQALSYDAILAFEQALILAKSEVNPHTDHVVNLDEKRDSVHKADNGDQENGYQNGTSVNYPSPPASGVNKVEMDFPLIYLAHKRRLYELEMEKVDSEMDACQFDFENLLEQLSGLSQNVDSLEDDVAYFKDRNAQLSTFVGVIHRKNDELDCRLKVMREETSKKRHLIEELNDLESKFQIIQDRKRIHIFVTMTAVASIIYFLWETYG